MGNGNNKPTSSKDSIYPENIHKKLMDVGALALGLSSVATYHNLATAMRESFFSGQSDRKRINRTLVQLSWTREKYPVCQSNLGNVG